jgi:hypothetical protein
MPRSGLAPRVRPSSRWTRAPNRCPKPEADSADASVPFGFRDDEGVSGARRCPIPLALQEQPTLLVRVPRRDRCDLRDVGIAAGLSHEGEVLDLPGTQAEGPGSKFGEFERHLHLTRVYATVESHGTPDRAISHAAWSRITRGWRAVTEPLVGGLKAATEPDMPSYRCSVERSPAGSIPVRLDARRSADPDHGWGKHGGPSVG